MPVASLRHVAVEVRDMERSRPFYDRLLLRLGFRRFASEPDYAGYAAGGFSLWVVASRHPRVRRHPPTGDEEVVAEHLAFWVPSRDDVRSLQEDLARDGIYALFRAEEHPEFRPGYFSASWVDPDETVIEVYTVPERRSRSAPSRSRPPAGQTPRGRRGREKSGHGARTRARA